jgi:kinesin family protein 5
MYQKPDKNKDDEYYQNNQNSIGINEQVSNPININQNQQPKLKKDSQRFNIVVRIRPQVEHDKIELTTEDELRTCIFKQSPNKITLINEKTDNKYDMLFDYVFDEKDNQETVYNAFGEKLMNDIFRGYNGTIMAYGQTGSGKTYTMFGRALTDNESGLNKDIYDSEKGIVKRAIHKIFEYRNLKKEEKSLNVYVSFMQIYLNQITDLLDKKNGVLFSKDKPEKDSNRKKFSTGKESKNLTIENSLKVCHDKDGKIYVKGLSVLEAKDESSLLLKIEEGLHVRRTAETIMNKMSSRSHVILQITVRQMWKEKRKNNLTGEITQNIHRLKGILTIVDLAGSESLSRTGSEGLNQDEAKEINKSISALGRVIESLSRQSQYIDMNGLNEKKEVQKRNNFGSKKYVSYRDSKLTEILSECLGGNSKTYIVANVSPFAANCEETYSTLQFASRAMIIRTAAKKNEKISSKKMNKDGQEIDNDRIYQNINSNTNPINANKKGNSQNNSEINKIGGLGLGFGLGTRDRGFDAKSGFSKLFSNEANKEEEKIMEGKKADYQGIAEKFYSIILHLQEELGKITVQNYTLEQENNFLREQLRNID